MEESPFTVVLTCAAVPVPVVENTWFEAADGAAARLRAAGAEADVVCGSGTHHPAGQAPGGPRPCAAGAWFASDRPVSRS